MTRTTYRVGVVGCGRIASALEDDPLRPKPASHAGAFSAHPRTAVTAGCDINGERAEAFGKRWGVSRIYADYERMLADGGLDIVSVASWTETHADVVVAAARAGVKGVYCEKPIATNLADARRMIDACRENGVALVVGHERRWDGRYRVIRDMLKEGKLGELRSITGYTLSSAPPKLDREKHCGGAMFHDGTHLVDIFSYFAGEADSVIGLEDRPHGESYVENTALGIISYKNGARGMILGGGKRDYFHFELDLHTDTSRVVLGNHIHELYVTSKSERYTGFRELKKAPFPNGFKPVNSLVGGVDDLVAEMETGRPSVSGGEDGYRALETILALYRSAGAGGAPVHLPI